MSSIMTATACALALLVCSEVAAQPAKVPIQGTLADAGGTPLQGVHSLRLAIYDADAGGVALYTETHAVTVSGGGIFSVNLGDAGTLDLAIFSGQTLFLGIGVGSDPEMAPRLRFGTVPYAARSLTVPWSGLGEFPSACAADSFVQGVGANGAFDCAADTGLTTLVGSGGVTVTPSGRSATIGLSPAVQTRTAAVPLSCPAANSVMKSVGATGATTCATFSCTTKTGTAGAGISTALCSSSEIMTGGGCTTAGANAANFAIFGNAPQNNGWQCNQQIGAGVTVTAHVRCCRF